MLELGITCVVSAAAWVYLVAAHGGYWRTGCRLPAAAGVPGASRAGGSGPWGTGAVAPGNRVPPLRRGQGTAAGTPARWPDVTAVVPARNEVDMLPLTLPALLAQEYPGRFRVTLVDDGSADGTGQVAADLGAASPAGGATLTVVAGAPRPDGWAGKVWAMAQGLAASGTAADNAGEPADPDGYVLFTDADIAWAPGALSQLVTAAEYDDRALVSQMALLRAQTAWERVVVPAFVYFFAQLYPFRMVNRPGSRVAAGAGGCMLVRRPALEKAGGLERIRGALIDDVALARLIKQDGRRIWLGLATGIRSVRPYPGLAGLWQMIARSAYVQLRYSPALLAATIAGLVLLYAVPPAGVLTWLIAAAAGSASPALLAGLAGLAGWALMTVSFVPMLRFYRLPAWRAPSLPLIAMLYAAMTADSARRHYAGRAVSWRGRPAGRANLPANNRWVGRCARYTLAFVRVPEMKLWAAEPCDSAEMTRDFLIADVFTDTPLEGNQLGIFPDGRGLSGDLMHKATREMNFSETVFFLPPLAEDADARVRIFSPGRELPFAGHPTLGSAWVLGELLGKDTVTLQLGVGLVPVELEREDGMVTFGWMSQPVPEISRYDRTAELLDALGAAAKPDGLPVEAYANGPVHVYVEFADEATVAALQPDLQKLSRLPVGVSCFSRTDTGFTARMFAPALGVTEDPATGSAAGPLALHLARHGRIAFGEQIQIRQGAQVGRPSVLYARVDGAAGSVEAVRVGGRAVVVAQGQYRLR